jgi:hypothetical protein
VGVVIEASSIAHRVLQGILAGMTERRVAQVVREAQSFRQVLVEAKGPRDRAADLRDLDAVSEAHPVMIAVRRYEDLSLVAESTKRNRMDDPVTVALKDVAWAARACVHFRMSPAARS